MSVLEVPLLQVSFYGLGSVLYSKTSMLEVHLMDQILSNGQWAANKSEWGRETQQSWCGWKKHERNRTWAQHSQGKEGQGWQVGHWMTLENKGAERRSPGPGVQYRERRAMKRDVKKPKRNIIDIFILSGKCLVWSHSITSIQHCAWYCMKQMKQTWLSPPGSLPREPSGPWRFQ